jgi:hypothetical protein
MVEVRIKLLVQVNMIVTTKAFTSSFYILQHYDLLLQSILLLGGQNRTKKAQYTYIRRGFVPVKGKSTNTAEFSSGAVKIILRLPFACRQLPNTLTRSLAEISENIAEVLM